MQLYTAPLKVTGTFLPAIRILVVSNSLSGDERVFSIDRALKLIESRTTEELSVHAASLLLSVLPLLEFADGVLQLDLESYNQYLRQQLDTSNDSDIQ